MTPRIIPAITRSRRYRFARLIGLALFHGGTTATGYAAWLVATSILTMVATIWFVTPIIVNGGAS